MHQSSAVLCLTIPNRLIRRAATKIVAGTKVAVVTMKTDLLREWKPPSMASIGLLVREQGAPVNAFAVEWIPQAMAGNDGNAMLRALGCWLDSTGLVRPIILSPESCPEGHLFSPRHDGRRGRIPSLKLPILPPSPAGTTRIK
jgi:hypothetical protein